MYFATQNKNNTGEHGLQDKIEIVYHRHRNKMKTLIFSNQGLSASHLGIELEIIENEIASGNEVKVVYCKSNLSSCFFNPTHNIVACGICEGRITKFYQDIPLKKENFTPLKKLGVTVELPQLNHITDLFKIEYKGLDIGRGIAASFISTHRNYDYKTSDLPYIQELANMCADVVETFEEQIKLFKPDQIILFNGRFAEHNAIIEICSKYGIDYKTFERSSAKGKYKFFKNMLPHSLKFRGQELKRIEQTASKKEIEQIGKKWFEDRQHGGTGIVKKYLENQQKGSLPNSFDSAKHNVAIFIASEDEHAAIKEHQSDLFKSQNEAIVRVVKEFQNEPSIHFYLRVHPNLKGLDSEQTRQINDFDFPNLTVIQATEKVDSYELMTACNKVLTFGSATGIEACYIGKPSILFGHAYYESIDVCYHPQSYKQLYSLINTKDLKAKPKENCYIFGFYQLTVGIEYKKFKEQGKNNSYYDNKKLSRFNKFSIPILIRNISQFSTWSKMTKLVFKVGLNLKNMRQLNSHVLTNKTK